MIAITLSEKEAIKRRFPDVHIARTMKQDSKRHHYYMVEERGPVRYLNELRGIVDPGERRRDRKKGTRGYRKGV
jgi:hypothetical protein